MNRACLIVIVVAVLGSFLTGVYEGMQRSFRRQFLERRGGCQETVHPYWNTLLECTSETCHRPLPCVVHGPHGPQKGGAS